MNLAAAHTSSRTGLEDQTAAETYILCCKQESVKYLTTNDSHVNFKTDKPTAVSVQSFSHRASAYIEKWFMKTVKFITNTQQLFCINH